jgi:hypothetical protein
MAMWWGFASFQRRALEPDLEALASFQRRTLEPDLEALILLLRLGYCPLTDYNPGLVPANLLDITP